MERQDETHDEAIDPVVCLRGLQSAGTLACATRAADGSPRVRFLSGIHFELDAVYILASNGMPFAKQLLADDRIQLLGEVRRGVSVRLTGTAELVPEDERMRWRLRIFAERPDYRELYPPLKYDDSLVFTIRHGYFEYLDLVSVPIKRVYVPFGDGEIKASGFVITPDCARCGSCRSACPQDCIRPGDPFRIVQENCLQCGACVAACPRGAIRPVA
ncbi:MAG: 4Fe-4S binding protein [Kiritimatiellae bacterium]|nr:4Fe-4S binding protein [Kiritimatiellia bacterium]MBR1837172.1 4Fe-4S binding protein [Kiritimatiellia bacterium]